MPVKRQYLPVPVNVADGGKLQCDVPVASVGSASYLEKSGWRRESNGKVSEEVKREGMDFFWPNAGQAITLQKTIIAATAVQQMGEARRGNGTSVPVGVAGQYICWFDYDNHTWTPIGWGYATSGIRRWQIVLIADFVVFNNGVDLPCSWQIGDGAVTPLYELRERGVASVGVIWEYNAILKCGDILQIDDYNLGVIMTGGDPYGRITDPAQTERVQYREIWSNNGDPRDWGATVNGTIGTGTPTLVLDWPLASLVQGDTIEIIGAGVSGGNLTTVIDNISGTTITVHNNASTTATNTPVQKPAALTGIVGYYDFQTDGSAIIRGIKLGNREIIVKETGFFVGYYTGDVDTPFVYDECPAGSAVPFFPWTLVNVKDQYLLFAGERYFYRFSLSALRSEIDPVMADCKDTLFFSRVSTADKDNIFAVVNPCTNEVFIHYRYVVGGTYYYAVVARDFQNECADNITTMPFQCAAVIHKPKANRDSDDIELWYIMGGLDGTVTLYGKTNLAVLTQQRYGVSFLSRWLSGLEAFGDPNNEKIVKTWTPIFSAAGSAAALTFKLYGADDTNQTPVLLETKVLTNATLPRFAPLYYQKIYFQECVECSANAAVRIAGRVWEATSLGAGPITRNPGAT